MAYIVIGKQASSLPIATRITTESVEEALSVVIGMTKESDADWTNTQEEDGSQSGFRSLKNNSYEAWFLLDQETNEIKRIYYNSESEIQLTDTDSAFQLLGDMTSYQYFEENAEADTATS